MHRSAGVSSSEMALGHRGWQYNNGPVQQGTQTSHARVALWTGAEGPHRPMTDLCTAARAEQQGVSRAAQD